MTRCGSCGADNKADAVFCDSCNHFLQWDDSEASPPEPPPPPSRPVQPSPSLPPTDHDVRTVEAEAEGGVTAPAEPGRSVHDIMAAIEAGRQIATHQGRGDLERHLADTQTRLSSAEVPVVVCGEFKRGKSTLVNALLQHAVCPVDADIVTAVPTTVRFAEKPYVMALTTSPDDDLVRREEYPLEALETLVTEERDKSDPTRQRSVEVGLPHGMLRSGLCLVDTPGVGGLDSAHGFLTLGALRHAQGVLFVTDAAQELTGPELAFLRTSIERCETACLVVTKIDLYPQWRRIVELNRAHLRRADLSIPVIAVSSFLRLRAIAHPELNQESGFADLVTFLARDVVARQRVDSVRTAAHEVEFVASQLQQRAEVERVVIDAPQQREKVVAELDQARQKVTKLATPTATWQLTLGDGIQDLVSDVEHDLQRRLRTVLTDVEQVIDQGDPLRTWADTEVWLRRQVAMVTVENRDLLTQRAEQLATSVAEQFDLQAGDMISLQLSDVGDALDRVALAPKSSLAQPAGKLASMMGAARTSFYMPWVLGSVAANIINPGAVVFIAIAGISVLLGAGIGRKIIKDERARQLAYRQQQAKSAARRFVDEVAFLMNKQSRDGLRATQRQLRDDFQARAMLLQRSVTTSLEAARQAAELDEKDQAARRTELASLDERLREVRAAAREMVGSHA